MRRTAFVTGAAGFLGRHLIERLTREGWTITAFCRPTDPVRLLPPTVSVETGDLADARRLADALPERVDAIFHLAGNTSTWSRHRDAQFRDNVEGTAHVIDAALAKQAGRLVYTSSISAWGYHPGLRLNEDTASNATKRGDNYGKSKLAAERLIKQACNEHGLNAVILNPVNILGAYDASNWSKQLILPISNGSLRAIPPGSASWISAHDVVDAHVAAVDSGGSGRNIILGGVEASFRDIVNEIERILDKPVTGKTTSKATLRMLLVLSLAKATLTRTEPEMSLAKYRRAVGDLLVDDQRARTELGLERTPLREQLEQTISWLREVELLPRSAVSGERQS
jgi:dihydroflavonol-4-reductase